MCGDHSNENELMTLAIGLLDNGLGEVVHGENELAECGDEKERERREGRVV